MHAQEAHDADSAQSWEDIGESLLALGDAEFKKGWAEMPIDTRRLIPHPWFGECAQRFRTINGIKNGHNVLDAANALDARAQALHAPKRNLLNWAELAKQEPPKFEWLWDHWLSFHAHGIWGRGGVGKSLIAQQIETACAIGRPLWGNAHGALPVLAWHCEDDKDEIWRRQDRICKRLQIGFDMLNNLHIDARCGLENALFTTEYGRPMWTPLYGELEEQVNDLKAQVLVLDNIAQIFGGNLNDQHHVTTFVNGILGLVRDRPFCPIFLGHIAKSEGSEFAGAMAWENAIRLRMLFTSKLPDETDADPIDSGADASDTRFLCKRKANYTREDYVQFRYDEGIFTVQGDDPGVAESSGGMMDSLRAQRARTVTLSAVKKLADMGINTSEAKGPNYLPTKVVEMRLGEGFSKHEIRVAMNALMVDGEIVKGEVGRYAKGSPKYGLVVPPKA